MVLNLIARFSKNWGSPFIVYMCACATLKGAGLPSSSSMSSTGLPSSSSMSSTGLPTSSSMTSSSNSMQPLPPLEKPTPVVQPPAKNIPPPIALPKPVRAQASYFYPGIIVSSKGTWDGGDDLLNLTNNIGFYISVIKPDNDPLAINQEMLKSIGENLFKKVNISPVIMTAPGMPPLPFFQIQILIYPIGREGYVACCEGRLFESVNIQRVVLDLSGMAYQAVTWQKSNLIISPNHNIHEQIQQHVEDIVQAFTERYQTFESLKKSATK